MNENVLYVVKEYKVDNPHSTKIVSIRDSCYRDFHNNCFHKFIFESIYDIKLTNITNSEFNS